MGLPYLENILKGHFVPLELLNIEVQCLENIPNRGLRLYSLLVSIIFSFYILLELLLEYLLGELLNIPSTPCNYYG